MPGGVAPRTTPSFWHAPKGCKSAPKGVPTFGIPPLGRPANGRRKAGQARLLSKVQLPRGGRTRYGASANPDCLSALPTRPGAKNQAVHCLRALLISPEGTPQGAMVRGSEAGPSHFSRSDFRTIAEGACRTSLSPAPILSPGAQRGFQRGVPFDTFFLPFDVYQKAVVVRGRNPAAK